MELATDTVYRYTDILHGAFYPHEIGDDGELLFSSYSLGDYELYRMDIPQPVEQFAALDEALPDDEIDRIEEEAEALTDIELSDQNRNQSAGGGWHISNIQIAGGYSSTGTILANTFIELEDLLGNHRLTAIIGSIESQRNYTAVYTNQKNRWNWGVLGTSQRAFFFTFDLNQGNTLQRQSFFELDGGEIFANYPFGRDWRMETSVGYYRRQYAPSSSILQGTGGELILFNERFRSGTYMPVRVDFVGDRARFKEYGPFAGRRLRIGFEVAPPGVADLQFYNTTVDFRQYIPITKDSQLAFRIWGAASFGDDPTAFFLGGLNQLRGYEYLQFAGSRAGMFNLEYRFPIVWEARAGDFALRHIRGVLFADVGTAWFRDEDYTFWENGALQDAVASVGFGVNINLVGLPLWFFWAQRTDFDQFYGGLDFSFYIGPSF
jgi:outer membrane protein assembly factor BamA